MKKVLLFLLLSILSFPLFSSPIKTIYKVTGIYSKTDIPDKSVAIVGLLGTPEQIDYILTPIELEKGEYKITVDHVGSDVFKITGENIYLLVEQEYITTYKPNYRLKTGEAFLDLNQSDFDILLNNFYGYLVTSP